MKKILTSLTLIAILAIIYAAYFGIYGFAVPEEYMTVIAGMKNTLTLALLSCAVACITAVVPGVLIGKTGIKTAGIVSSVIESVAIVAPFIISTIVIILFGNGYITYVCAVALPLFAISFSHVARNVAEIKGKNYRVHKYSLSRGAYFKNYALPFSIKPYFANVVKMFRTAMYTVLVLDVLYYIGGFGIGWLMVGGNTTSVKGIAVTVCAVFMLLVQILCFLTKQKEEYTNE